MTIWISEHYSLCGGQGSAGFPVLSSPLTTYTLSSGAGSTLNARTGVVRIVSDTAPVWAVIAGSTGPLTSTSSLRLSSLAGEAYLSAPAFSTANRILQVQTAT